MIWFITAWTCIKQTLTKAKLHITAKKSLSNNCILGGMTGKAWSIEGKGNKLQWLSDVMWNGGLIAHLDIQGHYYWLVLFIV